MKTDTITFSGATPIDILAQNLNRTYASIQNLGSDTIYVAGSSNMTRDTSFTLLPGDTITTSFYVGSYFAIGSDNVSGVSTLCLIEEE